LVESIADQEKSIIETFNELKSEKYALINKNHELYAKKHSINRPPRFSADVIGKGHNRIIYRLGTPSFDKDSLRFILLHEEGHLKQGPRWFYYTIAFAVAIILTGGLSANLFTSEWDWIIRPPVSLCLALKIFYPKFRKLEIDADLFAAEMLKKIPDTASPSLVAKKALYLAYQTSFLGRLFRLFKIVGLWILLFEPHPMVRTRVRIIKKKFS
jgi:hypothetical protein